MRLSLSRAFFGAGTLVATGSEDASIKILDIGRMMAKANLPPDVKDAQKQTMETHPVIRTLYDHNAEVTCVEFHPTAQILASGGRDYTLKVRKQNGFDQVFGCGFASLQEGMSVRHAFVETWTYAISLHPDGKY